MSEVTANPRPPLALQMLAAGVVLGLWADHLLWDYGLLPLVRTLLVVTGTPVIAWLMRERASPNLPLMWRWAGITLVCTLLALWRSNELLQLLLMLCTLGSIGLFLLQGSGFALRHIEANHALAAMLAVPRALLTRAPSLLRDASLNQRLSGAVTGATLRGLLFALPLLFVFSQLFLSADAAFARWADSLAWWSPSLPFHLLSIGLCCWFACSVLTLGTQPLAINQEALRVKPGTTETAIMLGALALAFTLFAGFQLTSLFESAAANVQRSGLTIAEFARHGFFQMLWIAALALGLLTLLAPGCSHQPWFRRFGLVLAVCVGIVLASAAQRILYYLQTYGLSVDRLVASAFIVWLALCLPLFGATVLRGRSGGFVAWAACLGVALCWVLAAMNPAALVVRTNIALANSRNTALDMNYLTTLGDDAVPALIDNFAALKALDKCRIASWLLYNRQDAGQHPPEAHDNWRYWTLAGANAGQAVAANLAMLQAARCQ